MKNNCDITGDARSEALNFYNMARRYCMDQFEYWQKKYCILCDSGRAYDGSKYSTASYQIFPRYNVLNAILNEIERIDSDCLPRTSELYDLLKIAGEIAENEFTKSENKLEVKTINTQRNEYLEYIEQSFTKIIPTSIPYRRILDPKEISSLWKKVDARWEADGSYYFPLKPM